MLLIRPCDLSASAPSPLKSISESNFPFVQSGLLPTSWYYLILAWRLFEILPPSPAIGLELHSLMEQLVRSQREIPFEQPKIAYSSAYLIYLAVFLDRLQGRPSNVEPQLLAGEHILFLSMCSNNNSIKDS